MARRNQATLGKSPERVGRSSGESLRDGVQPQGGYEFQKVVTWKMPWKGSFGWMAHSGVALFLSDGP